jgi:hypothetical protein
MQGVLVLHHVSPYPALGAPDDPHHLAVQHMGCGSSGAFQKAPGCLTHLLVVVDKFTKWAEAKPLAKIGSKQAVEFI